MQKTAKLKIKRKKRQKRDILSEKNTIQ